MVKIGEGTRSAVWMALTGVLFALGLILPVFTAADIHGIGWAVVAALLTMVCCVFLGADKKLRWVGLALLLAGPMLLLLVMGSVKNVLPMLASLYHGFRGNLEPLRVYGPEAAVLAGVVLTLGGYLMVRYGEMGIYSALSLMMLTMILMWYADGYAIWMFVPALVAVCMILAQSGDPHTPRGRFLVSSVLVVALAAGISPVVQIRSPKLETFAENLRTYITDTLFFTETRKVYSIQSDGFKPLENRLGGPVNIEEQPVMTVETPTALLLRGATYNEYTGLNWVSRLSSRRYLYGDVRNRSVRADVMDEMRPSEAVQEHGIFRSASVRVTMQSGSASTMFLPLRAEDLSTPMALVPYFNLSGEVFITRDLKAGDTYSFTAPVITSADSRLPEVVELAARESTETRDMSSYLSLHNRISDELPDLVRQVVTSAGARNTLEVALAIQNHLRTSYTYTLTPVEPPNNMDFVSYFLLRSKEGYCTYFASAMAVLCRIAGLPSRYVEGYLVEPVGGIALISSKHAHAWCEVYFDGFGWVAFDATPPVSAGGPRRDEGSGQQEEIPGEMDEAQAEQDEQQGADAPEPTPEPEGGGADSQPEPESGDPEAEEPQPETEEPQPETEDAPIEDQENQRRKSLWWLWLLLALATAALLGWRAVQTRPQAVADRRGNSEDKLLTWYQAILGMLRCADMPAQPAETPLGYAARVERALSDRVGLARVAASVTTLGYGREGVEAKDVRAASVCYRLLWQELPLRARVRWVMHRMLHGIGDIRQVP